MIQDLFKSKNMSFPPQQIFIRAFKSEEIVELWAKSSQVDTFCLITSYSFCSTSGNLGPKRKKGDLQTPEGFYFIDRFNPHSNFHLSLGINYPNASDKILGVKGNLGGDIFIHGNCVTIGCIPVTNDYIKELYLVAIYTKDQGQKKFPVHIFPLHLTKEKLHHLSKQFNAGIIEFWTNLSFGYTYFERTHILPHIYIEEKTGKYKLYNHVHP